MLYNIRKFYYEDGVQVRLYKRPVMVGRNQEDKFYDFIEKNDNPKVENSDEKEIKDEKRSQYVSMKRSKQMIYGIARSNKWDYFLTLTFNRNMIDSSDYKLVVKKAQKWLDNIRQRTSPGIKYLLVPELHADGKHWHLHGLLADCPELTMLDSGHRSRSGLVIYNLLNWKYGFSTVTEVTDNHKVSAYISKYITKELAGLTKGRQRYWASNNCIRPMQLCEHLYVSEKTYHELVRHYSDVAKHISERSSENGMQKIVYFEMDEDDMYRIDKNMGQIDSDTYFVPDVKDLIPEIKIDRRLLGFYTVSDNEQIPF